MREALELLRRHRFVPVATVSRAELADPFVDAMLAAGLPIAEFTLRTKAGLEAITRTAARGDALVGAGTVLDVAHAEAAIAAGARFLVAPGLDPELVAWAREHEVFLLPGVATATEITQALRLGVDVVKLFPTGPMGGEALVRALAGPFPGVSFVCTGGLTLEHLPGLFSHPSVLAVGGDVLSPREWIEAGRFAEIEARAREGIAIRDRAPAPAVPRPPPART